MRTGLKTLYCALPLEMYRQPLNPDGGLGINSAELSGVCSQNRLLSPHIQTSCHFGVRIAYGNFKNVQLLFINASHPGITAESTLNTQESTTESFKACPYLIRIRSTSISHLNPLCTKLDQYWINPLPSYQHYELNS